MTIDLRTGEQYAPCPTDYVTKAAPFAPSGNCPLWRDFLARVTDEDAVLLSHQIAQKIESDMAYPGQIKVTVIRETRVVNYAR